MSFYESNIAGHEMLCRWCWMTKGEHLPGGVCRAKLPPIVATGAAGERAVEILRRRGKLL